MPTQTFTADTLAQALATVRKELGPNARILRTSVTKPKGVLGLISRERVAVTAIPPGPPAPGPATDTPGARAKKAASSPAPAKPERTLGVSLSLAAAGSGEAPEPGTRASTARATSPAALAAYAGSPRTSPRTNVDDRAEPAPARGRAERPARGHASAVVHEPAAPALASLQEDLLSIKSMLTGVLSAAAPAVPAKAPEHVVKHYLKLLEGQVSREIADDLIAQLQREISPHELADPGVVRHALVRHLAALIPVADDLAPCPRGSTNHRPLTIALVGPTGVGKTTTLAKLAATYKLRQGRRVGLIAADTYRIAAVEQLRTYASIIALPMRVVLTPEEMRSACAAMRDCDVILIDTAGRSPRDRERIHELAQLLAAAEPDQTHLVLSSAASEKALVRAAEEFAPLKPNRMLFTKLDEAVNFGVIVSVARRVGARLSYLTTGQEVPDHLEPSDPERLARLVVDGDLESLGTDAHVRAA